MKTIDPKQRIESSLTEGESILWRGKPGTKRLLTGGDIFMLPFSIMWGGGSLGVIVLLIANGQLGNMPLLLYIFPIVGVYLLFGRFLHRRWVLKNTEYVITNRRLFFIKRGHTLMISADSLPPMKVIQRRNGSGTIQFVLDTGRRANSLAEPYGEYALENLTELHRVREAIMQMKSSN